MLEATVSSEDPCLFDAEFQDADGRKVTSVSLEFEEGGTRTVQGERYRATLKFPTGKTMEKVTAIVVIPSDR